MKTPKIFFLLSLIVSLGLLTQCEKYDDDSKGGTEDESGQLKKAGGKKADNPNGGGNEDSGTTKGGEYGDLFVLARDLDGVPEMIKIGDEYYVRPITEGGAYVELNDEGEVVDPTQAQEVEFGRLNIVRSPPSVLNQAFDEALKVLDPDNKGEHPVTISQDFCGRLTSHYFNDDLGEYVTKTIDSPRESMAIYKVIMQNLNDGRLTFLGGLDPLTVAASCFAAGSDKTGTVTKDEVVYINGFMDCTGNNAILNVHENKYYYNFSEPLLGANQFRYNRSVYANRWLKTVTLNPDNTYTVDYETVLDAMESRGLFTAAWPDVLYLVQLEGFTWAVDDAVQVLDFVHGDSNIEFLPDGPPPTP